MSDFEANYLKLAKEELHQKLQRAKLYHQLKKERYKASFLQRLWQFFYRSEKI